MFTGLLLMFEVAVTIKSLKRQFVMLLVSLNKLEEANVPNMNYCLLLLSIDPSILTCVLVE